MDEYAISPLCRAFLRQEYDKVDPRLEEWLHVLSEVGASECWHKKSTFKAHLFETYKISKLWGLDATLCDTMLFHSAYSNSYVNLAIFKATRDRPRLAELVGPSTEALIHLFCCVPRHDLIYERLLKVLPDDELHIPIDGITVPHIHTGEPLHVAHNVVAAFLALTMVDFCEQLMSWQDQMFENTDGKLYYAGKNAHVLWPAAMKPGLYHAALSRMGRLLRHAHEDAAAAAAAAVSISGQDGAAAGQGSGVEVAEGAEGSGTAASTRTQKVLYKGLPAIPPVYASCTALVKEQDERRARDLYWDVVCNRNEVGEAEEALAMLNEACTLNPFIAEPHVLLAQIHMQRQQYAEAHAHANKALELFCTWGTAWDKRMNWDAWCAWTRAILTGAQSHKWPAPDQPMGMLNLGLVAGLEQR